MRMRTGVALLACGLLMACPRVRVAQHEPPDNPLDDLVVNEDDCEGAGPAETSHAGLLADLDVVERVMREGWAGYELRASEGVDWKATFAELRAGVAALPEPVPNDQVRRYLARALAPARDNHLSFWWFDARGRRHQSSAGGHLVALTGDGGAGEGAFLSRDPLRIEKRPLTLAAVPPGPGWRRLVGAPAIRGKNAYERDGGVLRVRTFDMGVAPELEQFAKAGAEVRDAGWLVVDLRGNPGGGDGPAIAFAAGLTRTPLEGSQIDRLDTDVIRQGALNVATCEAARPDLDPETRRDFERLRRYAASRLVEKKFRIWTTRQANYEGTASETWVGPIVVLVDRDCASSCESAVTFIKQLPGALVVGENTAGTGVFGEALEYRLPSSGVWMRAGTKWFHAWEETRGILPDYWLDDPDPLGAAIELAQCLTRSDCPIARPRP